MRQQGGDRGKSPNVTGTQPKPRVIDSPRRETKGTKADEGQGSGKTRAQSPKKIPPRENPPAEAQEKPPPDGLEIERQIVHWVEIHIYQRSVRDMCEPGTP